MNKNDIKMLNDIIKKMENIEISDVEEKIWEIVYQISSERKKQNITQSKLSAMTGIPQTTISRIETHISTPTLPILIKITNALNMQILIERL